MSFWSSSLNPVESGKGNKLILTFSLGENSYFNRDVDCIRRFFKRRFKYESSVYPKFTSNLQNGVREFDLDVEVAASGFSKGERKVLEEVSSFLCRQTLFFSRLCTDVCCSRIVQYMAELAAHDKEHGSGEEEEEEYSDEELGSGQEEEGEDEEDEEEEEPEKPVPKLEGREFDELPEEEKERLVIQATTVSPTTTTTTLEDATDRFGNLLIAEPEDEEDEEDEEEESGEEDEDGNSDEGESSDVGSVAPSQAPRMRPKRQARDVSGIVTASLTRQQKSSERKHHGKKVASSNVLGRQKGSKKKASHNAAIKEGKKGEAFF